MYVFSNNIYKKVTSWYGFRYFIQTQTVECEEKKKNTPLSKFDFMPVSFSQIHLHLVSRSSTRCSVASAGRKTLTYVLRELKSP